MKLLIHPKTGRKYLIKDINSEFHTSEGVVKEFNLPEVKSNKGELFKVMEPNFIDLWEKIKRGPQIILQKDIGLIITKTGINQQSKVVDAGGGSGSLCCYLAYLCKEVTTYEIQDNLIEVLKQNKKLFGLTNLKIKQQNIYQEIEEKELDLITLDLAHPWEVIPLAEKALKTGGFLAVYLPNLIQMKMFIDALKGSCLKFLELKELIERKWKVESNILRPEYEMLGHTGFLCFCRKV